MRIIYVLLFYLNTIAKKYFNKLKIINQNILLINNLAVKPTQLKNMSTLKKNYFKYTSMVLNMFKSFSQ